MPGASVAVIGAGISGLLCARTLAGCGFSVTVFEKSRGAGGRMATGRAAHGLQFDHGAQYFTVRDERFRRYVDAWVRRGVAAEWDGRIAIVGGGRLAPERETEGGVRRYVGVPAMNAVCKRLAEGLEIHYREMIAGAWISEHVWLPVNGSAEEQGRFDVLVVSTPAPQAAILLRSAPALSQHAAAVQMSPCWAVMAAFPARLPIEFDGAFVQDSPLSWVARNNSKQGRPPSPECWVLHGSPDWSREHLEEEPETVSTRLLSAFAAATGVQLPEPMFAASHRWRYALPAEPLPDACLFDDSLGIGACGDWCNGPRIEGAFLSGMALAERILARYEIRPDNESSLPE